MRIELKGVPQAIAAMQNLTRATQIRGVRIGLNAAVGQIKNQLVANLRHHQDTGLLAKSQRVKVVIPAASRNPAHHDKPAWGLVGAGKGLEGTVSKRGKAKVLTAKGKAAAKAAGTRTLRASRYSHFPEKKHHDMARAAQSAGPAAQAKFAVKVGQFIQSEAAKIRSKP